MTTLYSTVSDPRSHSDGEGAGRGTRSQRPRSLTPAVVRFPGMIRGLNKGGASALLGCCSAGALARFVSRHFPALSERRGAPWRAAMPTRHIKARVLVRVRLFQQPCRSDSGGKMDDKALKANREARDVLRIAQGEAFMQLAQILFEEDPIGINFTDNTDEYEPEAGTILRSRLIAKRRSRSRTCSTPSSFAGSTLTLQGPGSGIEVLQNAYGPRWDPNAPVTRWRMSQTGLVGGAGQTAPTGPLSVPPFCPTRIRAWRRPSDPFSCT